MLDRRAELISGSLKPLSMVQGVTRDAGCALFVGYHAGAASRAGILDHTYYGKVVAKRRVGGRDWNETALNAPHQWLDVQLPRPRRGNADSSDPGVDDSGRHDRRVTGGPDDRRVRRARRYTLPRGPRRRVGARDVEIV